MQTKPQLTQPHNHPIPHQIAHVLVAGLWTSDKDKLIRHVSDVPLEYVDIVGDLIPVELPKLLTGELQVDSRLTAKIWGAPDQWRHDYVNYLVNIKTILNNRGDNHRVMGMIVVVDSVLTTSSDDEGKLVRLIQMDWLSPFIVVASHPYDAHARHVEVIREDYRINNDVPILPFDISQPTQAKNALIELMYRAM